MGRLFLNSGYSLGQNTLVGMGTALVAGAVLYGVASSNSAYAMRDHSKTVTQTRDVAAFTKIIVKGAIELELTAGREQSVTVTTRDKYQEKLETYVEDGTLIIDMSDDDDDDKTFNFGDDEDYEVEINVETLAGIEILGAVDAELHDIKAEDFMLDLRGAADLEIEGSCGTFTLDMRGAGDIDADDFECKTVNVDVRGAGAASVYASESVDADVSGVAVVNVYGNPKNVKQDSGGFSKVSIR